MADDQPIGDMAKQLRYTLRAPIDGEALKSVPANPPSLAPDRRHCVLGRFGGNRAVKRRIEDGDMRYLGKRPLGSVDCFEGRGVVKRRERYEFADLFPHFLVDDDGVEETRTTVDHPMRDGLDSRWSVLERLDSGALPVILDGMELQARRACIDDEDRAHALGSAGPGPVANLGRVLPMFTPVRASTQPTVYELLPQVIRLSGEPGKPINGVDREMKAIEVVQHHDVERRCGRSLFLVPAHVQVVVVRPSVRQPVDQPRVAVIGEHDRSVGREQ